MKVTIVSVVGGKQNCKRCAEKDSSQVDDCRLYAGPLYPLSSWLAESTIFFTRGDCSTSSENRTL